MLQGNAVKKTKDLIIQYIRQFLDNPQNYNDNYDTDYSGIEIYDKEPQELVSFPSILLTAVNGNYINSGLGDIAEELYDDNDTCIGYRYSGMLELPITIEVATRTTPARDELVDLITMTLRVSIRRQLELQGVLIKDIRYAGENEIKYNSNSLYIATLQFTTWSEWYKDVMFLPIKGINIEEN